MAFSIQPNHSRKIISVEKGPSVSKVADSELDQLIKEHAHMRLQLFFLQATAYYKKACQTDGTVIDIKVKVLKASMQVGQGNKENHAAHSNAAAGLSEDLRKHTVLQINKKNLTPLKTAVLRAKGLTEQDLNTIRTNHKDTAKVTQVINIVWPQNSLLQGTNLELNLNATDVLPTTINLATDLSLEKKIRPKMEKLIELAAQNKTNPILATEQLSAKIQKHFNKKIVEITEKIEAKKIEAKKNTEITKKIRDELDELQKKLSYHKLELEGTKGFEHTYLSKDFKLKNSNEMDVEATNALLKPLL